jgi:hypothetical protein
MSRLPRRDFIKTLACATVASSAGLTARAAASVSAASSSSLDSRYKLRSFNYDGVRLGQSRWADQFQHGCDFYLNVSNDDILQGFRAEAGLACPGKPLGGWAQRTARRFSASGSVACRGFLAPPAMQRFATKPSTSLPNSAKPSVPTATAACTTIPSRS